MNADICCVNSPYLRDVVTIPQRQFIFNVAKQQQQQRYWRSMALRPANPGQQDWRRVAFSLPGPTWQAWPTFSFTEAIQPLTAGSNRNCIGEYLLSTMGKRSNERENGQRFHLAVVVVSDFVITSFIICWYETNAAQLWRHLNCRQLFHFNILHSTSSFDC